MPHYDELLVVEIEMTAAVAIRLAEAAGREAAAMRAESQVQHAEGAMIGGQAPWTEVQVRIGSDRLWDEAAELANASKAIGKAALVAASASAYHAPASCDIDIEEAMGRAWNPLMDPAPNLQALFRSLNEAADAALAREEADLGEAYGLPEDPFRQPARPDDEDGDGQCGQVA